MAWRVMIGPRHHDGESNRHARPLQTLQFELELTGVGHVEHEPLELIDVDLARAVRARGVGTVFPSEALDEGGGPPSSRADERRHIALALSVVG